MQAHIISMTLHFIQRESLSITENFQPTLRNFFLKHSLADNVFCFYDRGSFLVLVMHKKFAMQVGQVFSCQLNRRFVSAEPGMFPFIRQGSQPSSTKKYYSPILIEKNDSRRRPGKISDRGLKKKFHRMMPIEHLLIAIMQISFSD